MLEVYSIRDMSIAVGIPARRCHDADVESFDHLQKQVVAFRSVDL